MTIRTQVICTIVVGGDVATSLCIMVVKQTVKNIGIKTHKRVAVSIMRWLNNIYEIIMYYRLGRKANESEIERESCD